MPTKAELEDEIVELWKLLNANEEKHEADLKGLAADRQRELNQLLSTFNSRLERVIEDMNARWNHEQANTADALRVIHDQGLVQKELIEGNAVLMHAVVETRLAAIKEEASTDDA